MSETPSGLEGRFVLVTGASRGIGEAVALQLAAQGAHVIALARPRSQGALEALDDAIRAQHGEATLVPLDLADASAVDKLGPALYERFGRLDGLVANAGILGPLTPLAQMDAKDFERLMTVNVTANWRLIRTLDPLFKLSGNARVLFVSSRAGRTAKPYWGGYATSKAALERLAMTYAEEAKLQGTGVNVLDPGPIRTRMRREAVPGEDPNTLPAPEEIAKLIADLMNPGETRSGEWISFYDWAGIQRDKISR